MKRLTELGFKCAGFADNIFLIIRGKFESIFCELLWMGLRIIVLWCLSVGLNINPNKTTKIPFTRKWKPAIKRFSMNVNILEWELETRYIAMTIVSKPLRNWYVHNITGRAIEAFMTCRRLCENMKIVRWMNIMIIGSIITYGAVAFSKAGSVYHRSFYTVWESSVTRERWISACCQPATSWGWVQYIRLFRQFSSIHDHKKILMIFCYFARSNSRVENHHFSFCFVCFHCKKILYQTIKWFAERHQKEKLSFFSCPLKPEFC